MLETNTLLESATQVKNLQEERFLLGLLKEYHWLGEAELIQIGESGWLIRLTEVPRKSTEKLLSLDFDDFLVDSLAAKTNLVEQLTQHLVNQYQLATQGSLTHQPPSLGEITQLLRPAAKKLAQLSDSFARWSDGNAQEPTYHSEGQAAALAWGIQQLNEAFLTKANLAETLHSIALVLNKIRPELRTTDPTLPIDWFFLGGKLVTPTYPIQELKISHNLINETLLKPKPQTGVIKGVTELQKIHRFTTLLLSSGDPVFQLMKIGEFLKTHPNLKPAMIALSRAEKGNFLQEAEADMLATDIYTQQAPTNLIHLDDLPLAAESLAEAIPKLNHFNLAVGRFKFATGKAAHLNWEPHHSQTTQFDFSQLPTDHPEFANRFIIEADYWLSRVFDPKQ